MPFDLADRLANPRDQDVLLFFGVGVPFVLVGLWLGICWLVALVGGWRSLARVYRARGPFTGYRSMWETAYVGGARYRNSLTVGADATGLYLAASFLSRVMGHPPLFIPWEDMTAARRGRWGFWSYVEFHFRGSYATLQLSDHLEEWLRGWAGPAWPASREAPQAR